MHRRMTTSAVRKRIGIAVPAAAAIALIAAGCSQPAEEGGGNEGEEQEALSNFTIVTGGTAGLYYPIGSAISQIIESELDADGSVESTGASVENIRLIAAGDADLAITQGDAADQAYQGVAEFDESIQTHTLVVLYPNVYHTVTLASVQDSLGLDCFADLEGSRYSVGDVGSGNEATTNQVFESLGLDPASDISRSQLGYAETTDGLRSGAIDAGSWVVGQGHGGISELAATDDIALVPMCDDEIASIIEGTGGYTEHTIPGGTYPGVDDDVNTIATWNALVAPPELNEEQAYELTKAIMENPDVIIEQYAAAEEYLDAEGVLNAPTPLHPGAIRYYEEEGVEIPDELRP